MKTRTGQLCGSWMKVAAKNTIGRNGESAYGILDFSQQGFGDTQMFGLIARRLELLKRLASMFAYFLGGEGGLIEPALLELMRLRGGLRPLCRGSASPILTRLRLGSLRATARSFAAVGLPADSILVPLLLDASRRHAGNRATLWLSA